MTQKKCFTCRGRGKLHNIPDLIVAFLSFGTGSLLAIFALSYMMKSSDEVALSLQGYYQIASIFLSSGIYLGVSFLTGRLLDSIFARITGGVCPTCNGSGRFTEKELTDQAELERKPDETERKLRIAQLERKLKEAERKLKTIKFRQNIGKITLKSVINRKNVDFAREKLKERDIHINKDTFIGITFFVSLFVIFTFPSHPGLFSKVMEYPVVSFLYSGTQTGLQILSDALSLKKTLNLYQVIHGAILLLLSFGTVMGILSDVRTSLKAQNFIRSCNYQILLEKLACIAIILYYAYEVITKWDRIDNLFLQ